MRPAFVIGDVHGNFDRLQALLAQEGLIDPVSGERLAPEVEVIQIGDLGDFGFKGSPDGDELCWRHADRWLDMVLWGNHDRAVFHDAHTFSGYAGTSQEVRHLMRLLEHEDRLRLAYACHGHLLTHAGLHQAFAGQDGTDGLDKTNPGQIADFICALARQQDPGPNVALWDAVGEQRGGFAPAGGILWRDWSEPIYDGVPQICGHTKDDEVRRSGDHWCIDIRKWDNRRLAGIWLPELRLASVDLAD